MYYGIITIKDACEYRCYNIAKWILKTKAEVVTYELFCWVCKHGHSEIAKTIHENYSFDVKEPFRLAYKNDHLDIAKTLYKKVVFL